MKKKYYLLLVLGTFIWGGTAHAQNVAIKTNALYWASTTPNLSIEIGFGKRHSFDIVGMYNPFEFGAHRHIKHWFVQPEYRLWTCEKFNRGFWGFHVGGGVFNAANIKLPFDVFPGLDDARVEGTMIGGGVSYGFQWYLGPHWNIEATFGFGYMYLDYSRYQLGVCGPKLADSHKHYFGPTKLGVTFVYLFKSKY